MDFRSPEPRERLERILPMINVVFLLLIFFLMTATIAPPEPLDVTPPESAAQGQGAADQPLYVAADGRLAWGGVTGEAVIPAIAAAYRGAGAPEPLTIRADRDLPGVEMARLLRRLAAAGVADAQLVTGAAR
ncbi:MAG: ExbD/TolR family protein [Paracoccaceae bacterium]